MLALLEASPAMKMKAFLRMIKKKVYGKDTILMEI